MLTMLADAERRAAGGKFMVQVPHWQPGQMTIRAMFVTLIATNGLGIYALLNNPHLSAIWARWDKFASYERTIARLTYDVALLQFNLEGRPGGAEHGTYLAAEDAQQRVSQDFAELTILVDKAVELGVQLPKLDATKAAISNTGGEGQGGADQLLVELRQMERDADLSASVLTSLVEGAADRIFGELAQLEGVSQQGMGGPLLPLSATSISDPASTQLGDALGRLEEAQQAVEDNPVHMPLDTTRISSQFGVRDDPFTGRSAFHSGIDFPAPAGTPVSAAARGTVIFSGWRGGYGRTIEIRHSSGFVSRYPHLSKALVAEGQSVEAEDQIGLVGSTGRSTGPHLHFEILSGSEALDPAPFLAAGRALAPIHPGRPPRGAAS